MNRFILFICLISFYSNAHAGFTGWLFGYENRWECILDRMPGTESDLEADNIYRQCTIEAPEFVVVQKIHGSIFGPDNAGECIKENVERGTSRKAAMFISGACTWLYQRGPRQRFHHEG